MGRIAIPFFKRIIAPNLLEFGSNFLSDITSGESAKSSAKRRGMESLKKTAKKLLTGKVGKFKKMACGKAKTKRRHVKKKSYKPKFGGKKRRKYSRKKISKRKKTSKKRKCIFDSNFRI